MNVEFAPSAVCDRRDIERFLDSPSRSSAEFSALMHPAVQHLTRWSGTAVRREDLNRADVLFWFENPCFLVLREEFDQINVVAVMHSIRRELRRRLRKNPVQ